MASRSAEEPTVGRQGKESTTAQAGSEQAGGEHSSRPAGKTPADAGSASPWPLLVALGAVTSEIGVLFGFLPVAVGGVLLFGGSCAGVLTDAGYAETVWRPLASVGLLVGAVATFVWAVRTPTLTLRALRTTATSDPFAVRAAVVLGAAVVLVAVGVAGTAVETRR